MQAVSTRRGFEPRGSRTALRRGTGLTAAAMLVVTLALAGSGARADNLDDQKAQLDQRAQEVKESLEFLDGRIQQTAADLATYQARLPGAQQALLDAQGRVAAASNEVDALAVRVDAAQQNKAKITAQLETDRGKMDSTKKLIGEIASESYMSGGVPSNVGLMLGSGETNSLTGSLDLADTVMESQNTALDQLAQQNAANVNSQARLAAVEAEIKDLKGKADEALKKEQAARDDAASKKAAVDKLVDDTGRLSKELEAQKPAIQKQIADVKAQQDQVAAQIQDRDRRLREAWEAEQRRIAAQRAEAARQAAIRAGQARAAAEAAAQAAANQAAEETRQAQAAAVTPSAFGLIHPFDGSIPITSGFGWRATPPGTIDFYGTGGYMHTGIDFGAACGTPVHAAAAGTVTVGGWTTGGGGWTVMISHGVVNGNSLTTVYYHNTNVVVSPGQQVSQGQVIAYSGSTGNSTGCHAHFETWLNGQPVNPMGLL
ncbi:murein DD-endopeptidase MepM/ murein hydrolase activator NlpD [Sinomonas atrocyanea]|uniref:M23 family metallopeptidase n=1 Tax=Sinomonas atrocyanea TaxID=37927 RepID=UPI00277EE7F0|nr:M23 family metallopeptidase [Sinomonas atrocyanea]MDP9885518.1 murein DD-endopeptidase MepM/ murein hydrolase activator NlpD [Sinomonas atrocyanea]